MIFSHLFLPQVDSTNAEALRRIASGQGVPFLLQAGEQLQGRGRGGSDWASPPGNFYGTFALHPEGADAHLAQLSFLAALCLAQVLEEEGVRPALKWPNDILIDGAKLSGILLEKHGPTLLIGMGVNVVSHPDTLAYPTISLQALGLELSAEDLGARLSTQVATLLARWQRDGFGWLQEAWMARAHGLGQDIRVRLGDGGVTHGRFAGIDQDGALQLAGKTGLERIHAGQVYFDAAGD